MQAALFAPPRQEFPAGQACRRVVPVVVLTHAIPVASAQPATRSFAPVQGPAGLIVRTVTQFEVPPKRSQAVPVPHARSTVAVPAALQNLCVLPVQESRPLGAQI
jgi:hypothetical protein